MKTKIGTILKMKEKKNGTVLMKRKNGELVVFVDEYVCKEVERGRCTLGSVYPKVTPTVFYCLPASSEAKYL